VKIFSRYARAPGRRTSAQDDEGPPEREALEKNLFGRDDPNLTDSPEAFLERLLGGKKSPIWPTNVPQGLLTKDRFLREQSSASNAQT